MFDPLGDRQKEYENSTRYYLPRRSYTLLRIDGKSFHTFCKNLIKPFDDGFIEDMDATAMYLCKNIMGAKCAFVQSDEISILIADYEKIETQAWFNNNLQKMCSVSASMATRAFNEARFKRTIILSNSDNSIVDNKVMKWAEFDSRVWQIPQRTEVFNYLVFRQQDTTRNSIQSVAQTLYSQKELNGKTSNQQQEMIFAKGINWNDYAPKYKRGRMIIKEAYIKIPETVNDTVNDSVNRTEPSLRTRWISQEPPIFSQDHSYLENLILINK